MPKNEERNNSSKGDILPQQRSLHHSDWPVCWLIVEPRHRQLVQML